MFPMTKNTPSNDNKAATPALIGQADAKQIAEWKEKSRYGLYGVIVQGRIAYFRVPDIDDLNYAYTEMDPTKTLNKWKRLADVTYLGGDEEILKNDRLFLSIIDRLQTAGNAYESELVNL